MKYLTLFGLLLGFAAFAAPPVPPGTVTVQLGKGQVPADVKVTRRKGTTSRSVLLTVNPDWEVKILEHTVMHGGQNADLTLVPASAFSAGWDTDRVRPTNELPANGGNGGAFRVVCLEGATKGPAGIAFNDRIVYPGEPGRAHLHTFCGNTDIGAGPPPLEGRSTSRGGTFNMSSYWVPTMLDIRNSGPVLPERFIIYYKSHEEGFTDAAGVWVPDQPQPIIQEFPKGFRIIAGNPTRTTPRLPTETFDHRWTCLGGAGGSRFYTEIPDCLVGEEVLQEVFYPECWDGKNVDSPDHKSHMAYKTKIVKNRYPDGSSEPGNRAGWTHNVCPDTHPIRLPQIAFNVGYLVKEPGQAKNWALSCDANSTPGTPKGYCSHGDEWINWKEQPWVQGCLRAKKDCHGHLLGDGRETF